MTKLSIAELRRRLPVGTEFVAEMIGSNAGRARWQHVLTHRTVLKNTASRLTSVMPTGTEVDMAWRGLTAREEPDGSIIVGNAYEEFLKIRSINAKPGG